MARVEIATTERVLDELREALLIEAFFRTEQRVTGSGLPKEGGDYAYMYETVERVGGLSIIIWADEHPPPHFHVRYQGEDASFSILDCSRLEGGRGLERYDGRIRAWRAKNQSVLIEKWNASPVQRIVQLGR
jgi:hypothetical protein